MRVKILLIHGLLISILCLSAGVISTVNGQDKDFRRVSLSLSGGAMFENSGNGFNLFDGRFNTFTETSGTFGAGLQYAITPAWSLEGGYSYTQIRGRSGSFETNFNTVSLVNILNFNQILSTNRIATFFNPYLTAGLGYDFYTYESANETFDDNSISYKLGVGLAFRLSDTIDLFTHYENQIASNKLDNLRDGMDSGFGADVPVKLTGGIRINFGKKGTTHPSWRPIPVEVSRSEYDDLTSQSKLAKEQEKQLAVFKNKLDEKESEHERQADKYEKEIDNLSQEMNTLKKQLQETEDNLAAARKQESKADEFDDKDTGASISSGHYVQVFASSNFEPSRTVRGNAIPQLQDVLENPESDVFIAKRKNFYEVMIGTFNKFQKANSVLEAVKDEYEGAFVITFDRPVSLQEVYEGIKKVNR